MTTPPADKTIWVSKGDVDYVGGTVTDEDGGDISSSTFTVGFSLSPKIRPSTFTAATTSVAGASNSERVVTILFDSALATTLALDLTKTYYCHIKVDDNPVKVPLCTLQKILPR